MEDLKRKANITMKELQDWCEKKTLVLNPKKLVYMVVARNGNSDYKININLGSQKITKQNVTKVLGILIQDDLKWDTQISHLSKKINAANHALYSIRKSISLEALIFVYYAYDYSFLIFGIMFWGG
jgi:hypothetical protein